MPSAKKINAEFVEKLNSTESSKFHTKLGILVGEMIREELRRKSEIRDLFITEREDGKKT